MSMIRPLDCIVIPLLASDIVLWFIALVTYAAVCREAIFSASRSRNRQFRAVNQFTNCDQFSAVISEAGATRD